MSGKTTLEKLASRYNTKVCLNNETQRKFVELDVEQGKYFVIDNGVAEPNTLLVATSKHNDFVKIQNNNKSFELLKTLLDNPVSRPVSRPSKKAVELFGELYAIG